MARLGRARARRGLGDMTGAMSDAEAVPEGLRHERELFEPQSALDEHRVPDQQPEPFRVGGPEVSRAGVEGRARSPGADPQHRPARIRPCLSGVGTAQVPVAGGGPIPIATWDEAQLIIAEAAGGQRAVDIINAFHDAAGLPGYDPATDMVEGPTGDNLLNMIIQERSRELFLEGHRFWDHRSFEIPLDPPPGAPYPKGGAYGSMRCFPLPDVEKNNNPNIPELIRHSRQRLPPPYETKVGVALTPIFLCDCDVPRNSCSVPGASRHSSNCLRSGTPASPSQPPPIVGRSASTRPSATGPTNPHPCCRQTEAPHLGRPPELLRRRKTPVHGGRRRPGDAHRRPHGRCAAATGRTGTGCRLRRQPTVRSDRWTTWPANASHPDPEAPAFCSQRER